MSPDDTVPRDEKVRQLLRLGTIQLREESLSSLRTAAAFYGLALEILPGDARALDGLGCVAVRSGDFVSAREYFQRAVSLAPDYDRAYEHLAFLALQEGNHREAQALFEAAIRINPLNFRARNNLAVLLAEFNQESGGDNSGSSVQLLKAAGIVAKETRPVPEQFEIIGDNLEHYQQTE